MDTIFKRLNELKTTIKEHVLSNQNLLKLIAYTDENALELPDIDDPQFLINNKIYFNPVVWDSTILDVGTWLLSNMRVSSIKRGSEFANVYLYFYIISHNDIYTLENGDTRVLAICDEITKSFDESYGHWLGKCELHSAQDITTRKDYYSVELQFLFTDFKKVGE